jgi:hypothetical protein
MARHPDDDEGELVYERGSAYLGDVPVAPRTVFALIRLCAISEQPFGPIGSVERYRINETGREILEGNYATLRLVLEGGGGGGETMSELTMYSQEIPGEHGNAKQRVRFDKTGRSGQKSGYVGISQYAKDGSGPNDRVLLSPKQVAVLLAFLKKPIRVEGME